MALNSAQIATLKADIIAKQGAVLAAFFVNPTNVNWDGVAGFYNTVGTFMVWRTDVTRAEIYHKTSAEATTWSWTFYKNQSVPEQNAWTQMFMGDRADISLPNLRAGIDAIFTAGSAVNATHAKAVGKRACTTLEQLLATGIGTLAAPATMGAEGTITAQTLSDVFTGRLV